HNPGRTCARSDASDQRASRPLPQWEPARHRNAPAFLHARSGHATPAQPSSQNPNRRGRRTNVSLLSPQRPRNQWVSFWITKSKPPSSRLNTITTMMTTHVMRMASCRVGHTTLRNSKRDSERNSRTSRPLPVNMNTARPPTRPTTTARTRSWPDQAPRRAACSGAENQYQKAKPASSSSAAPTYLTISPPEAASLECSILLFIRLLLLVRPRSLDRGWQVARQEGLEPPTCGFGDRCSAN